MVTEKIHGANFCMAVDREGVHAGKRKEWLGPEDSFFGFQRVVSRLRGRLVALADAARRGREDAIAVLVYGELFGGAYPHPQVPPAPGVEPVQTGIWYAPDVEFCAFDVAVVVEEQPEPLFLDYDRGLELLAACGILAAEPLAVCSYRDALAFPERFSSTLPGRLGLPPLFGENLAEGVVLRPQRAIHLDTPKGRVRPLIKKKIAEFAEDERYAGARPWVQPPRRGVPTLDLIEQEAAALLTPARVEAAISKVGRPINAAGRALVLDEVVADLWAELSARLAIEVAGLCAEDRALLSEVLRDASERLLIATA